MRTSDYTTNCLPSYQQKYLRSISHRLKPIVRIIEITEQSLLEIRHAFSKEELIKVRLDHPSDKELLAVQLAEKSKSYLCGLLGHTVLLYRPFSENPVIQLPQRDPKEKDS